MNAAPPVFEAQRGEWAYNIVTLLRIAQVRARIEQDPIAVKVIPAGFPKHIVNFIQGSKSLRLLEDIGMSHIPLEVVIVS